MAKYFLALLWSLFDVTDTVIYKRVAEITEKEGIDRNFLFFLGYAFVLITLPFAWIWYSGDFVSDFGRLFSDFKIPWLLLLVSLSSIAAGYFNSYAYANEKISVLAPYSQVSEILSIVIGFFLFRETTSVSVFVWALVASSVIFFSGFKNGKPTFWKFQIVLTVSEVLAAFSALAAAYLVIEVAPVSLVFGQAAAGFAILAAYGLVRRKGFSLPPKGLRKPFLSGLFASNMLWILSSTIGLVLYSEIGIVATILLSMISLGVTLALSYLFYKDKPSGRDVSVAVLVVLCIAAAA